MKERVADKLRVLPGLRFMRHQVGGGVMFSAGIIEEILVGPFLVPESLKMNSANYCKFLNEQSSSLAKFTE